MSDCIALAYAGDDLCRRYRIIWRLECDNDNLAIRNYLVIDRFRKHNGSPTKVARMYSFLIRQD